MATAFDQAWASSETESPQRSLSQNELIDEFHRLDALVKEYGALRKEAGMQLAGIAFEKKADQNTVHLEGAGGRKIKVEFGIDYEYETEQMLTAMDLLGKDAFDSLFKSRLEFVPKKRELKKFMNTVSSDERTETAKKVIKDATITKEKSPYVSVE